MIELITLQQSQLNTSNFEVRLHRLVQGAKLEKEQHYLPRFLLALRGTAQMYHHNFTDPRRISTSQGLLLHPYQQAHISNVEQEEAWIVEFIFFTLDPLPAPAVRSMMGMESGSADLGQRFELPDWNVHHFDVPAGDSVSVIDFLSQGYVCQVDAGLGLVKVTQVNPIDVIHGGDRGKQVLLIQCCFA